MLLPVNRSGLATCSHFMDIHGMPRARKETLLEPVEPAPTPFSVSWRVTDGDGHTLRLSDLVPEHMRDGVADTPLEARGYGYAGTTLITGITNSANDTSKANEDKGIRKTKKTKTDSRKSRRPKGRDEDNADVFTAGLRLAIEAEPRDGPRWLAYGLAFAKVEGEPGKPATVDRLDTPGAAFLRDAGEEAVVTLLGEWSGRPGPRLHCALLMLSMDLPDGWPPSRQGLESLAMQRDI